jgi:hypothetical protein
VAGPLATIPRNESWVFVPFADAYCADGTTTGIGVNLTSASDDLLIYLNGGGACWDEATCQASCATNLTSGYDETHGTPAWSSFTPTAFAGTIFDRHDAANPTKAYNYIHVFYCTADTHAGNRVATYTIKGRDGALHPVHHVGLQNLRTYLAALSAAFHPHSVVLSGSSAGGFGSYTGYDLVARTFAPTPVYMVDDAGPYLENAATPPNAGAAALAWGLADALPAACTECLDVAGAGAGAGMSALATYLSRTYPDGRMALVTTTEDHQIRQRYALDGPGFAAALTALATDVLAPLPNFRYFYAAGNAHTLMGGLIAQDTSCGRGVTSVTSPPATHCGQTLQQFFAEELTGSLATWTNATPPPGVVGPMEPVPDGSRCSLTQ